MDPTSSDTAEPAVVFRPRKKAKMYRQRADAPEPSAADETGLTAATSIAAVTAADAPSDDTEEGGLSVADALRRRNARKPKLRGVEFRAEEPARAQVSAEDAEQALVLHEAGAVAATDAAGGMRRFMAPTGHTGELVNRHMEEYIESELAKRRRAESSQLSDHQQDGKIVSGSRQGIAAPVKALPLEGQSTMQGKLQEIDLGEEVRARNIAMTARAQRQLMGEEVEEEEEDGPRKAKRVRLGRDGKPWRGRKRRDSDGIKRDQHVEQFLSENRLDVYEQPVQESSTAAEEDDGAADERIAEAFRREFDLMTQRQKRKPAPQPAAKHGAKKDEEVLRGPRLGGSRNSRAAMRDLLLKQEQQKNARR